jgi:hypothetical protein
MVNDGRLRPVIGWDVAQPASDAAKRTTGSILAAGT